MGEGEGVGGVKGSGRQVAERRWMVHRLLGAGKWGDKGAERSEHEEVRDKLKDAIARTTNRTHYGAMPNYQTRQSREHRQMEALESLSARARTALGKRC